ncbi:MAG: tryptophan synthase subunit alpha [Amphritea sp.]|nr:tryptophan synthase subunit alpha [Amphritea sp.]
MNELKTFIQAQRNKKPLLLMTHVVYGYPSVAKSLEVMAHLLDNGVELLEVQFPFSDPVADGPVITAACHEAISHQPKLEQCIEDIKALSRQYPDSKLLLMSYLNPVLNYGVERLAETLSGDIAGIIIPDITIQGQRLLAPLDRHGVTPVWIITPDTATERIAQISDTADGMLYCVSNAGVTGQQADGLDNIQSYLARVRQHTGLPLSVGFGISSGEHLQRLAGHADVAIVGSALLKAFNQDELTGVAEKLSELQSAISEMPSGA